MTCNLIIYSIVENSPYVSEVYITRVFYKTLIL